MREIGVHRIFVRLTLVLRPLPVSSARATMRARNYEKIDLAIAFNIPSLTVGIHYQPLTNPDGNGGDPRSGFFYSPAHRVQFGVPQGGSPMRGIQYGRPRLRTSIDPARRRRRFALSLGVRCNLRTCMIHVDPDARKSRSAFLLNPFPARLRI